MYYLKNYSRPELDKTKLGEMIDLFSFNLGNKEAKSSRYTWKSL